MRAAEPNPDDLFCARLSQQSDSRHPLVCPAGLLDWRVFENRFGPLDHPRIGRPGIPIRPMIGLCYPQHTCGRADQEAVARRVENPGSARYWPTLPPRPKSTHRGKMPKP